MKIITWNVSCLPPLINPYMNPNLNINNIIKVLIEQDADIICLQEVFDNNIRNKLIKNLNKYKYYWNDYLLGDGLIIFSKYDIINSNKYKFKNFYGFDCFVRKGIISILIYDNINKKNIWIHNTHLQSDVYPFSKEKTSFNRMKQLDEIDKYLKEFNQINHIISGDLNIKYDIFKNLKFNEKFICNNYEIKTFPAFDLQFDYILPYFDYKINEYEYKILKNKYSDHYLLALKLL